MKTENFVYRLPSFVLVLQSLFVFSFNFFDWSRQKKKGKKEPK